MSEVQRELLRQVTQARDCILAANASGDDIASDAYDGRLRDLLELASRLGLPTAGGDGLCLSHS